MHFKYNISHKSKHQNICLHTHSGHRLAAQIQTKYTLACMYIYISDTQICTDTHKPPHKSYCCISTLAFSFPCRLRFRWNVSFNGNGKWNNKKQVFLYCILVKRVVLLDGKAGAFWLVWLCGIKSCPRQWTFLLELSFQWRMKSDCFSKKH